MLKYMREMRERLIKKAPFGFKNRTALLAELYFQPQLFFYVCAVK